MKPIHWKHWKKILLPAGKVLLGLLLFSVVALLGAYLALQHPSEIVAVQAWFYAHRLGWLLWRLMLYVALGWLFWKIHHAPGFRTEYRQPLRRIMLASVAFIVVCEYTFFKQLGA
ncbi:hypothetical protein [Serratia microhaemolytica]|uniref:hypothetical protein n=1 Tax=Serratia microhaemolytica TaxID=2675110 RepID=UPI000FDD53FD|nr:hypothetical protein [Serratia microhaemolytica]